MSCAWLRGRETRTACRLRNGLEPVVLVRVVADHLAPEAREDFRRALADQACPHDADRLAVHVKTNQSVEGVVELLRGAQPARLVHSTTLVPPTGSREG